MKPISNWRLFGLSILLGMTGVLLVAGYDRWTAQPRLSLSQLTADIWVSEQLKLDDISALKARRFATIIDLRPDGEADDQPAAAVVEAAVRDQRMSFSYVPVPHGDIPDDAVTALDKAISNNPKPILLYCRSGRRAARTWSLVEASRPHGLSIEAIQAAVKTAGQSAEDLNGILVQRIAHRPQTNGGKP